MGPFPGSGSSPGEGVGYPLQCFGTSLVTEMVRNPPAVQETWARFLGGEDPLEEGMATHSGILAWRIPRTEEPGRLQSTGSQESDMTEHSIDHDALICRTVTKTENKYKRVEQEVDIYVNYLLTLL